MKKITKKTLFLPLLGASLLFSACSDSDGSNTRKNDAKPSSKRAPLAGTAAIGQAIVGASITAECQDGTGFTETNISTNGQGKWSGFVDSQSLPCVLTLTGGNPNTGINFRSIAFAAGTVNITPLTHAVLAMSTASSDFSWVAEPANWPTEVNISNASNSLLQALKSKGYGEAGLSGNFFTTAFDANGQGMDKLLDDVRALVEDPSSTVQGYQALAQLLAEGNLQSLPQAPTGGGNTNPPVTATTAVAKADLGGNPNPTETEFMAAVSQTFDVAIYDVPESNPQWYGDGKLVVSGSSSADWQMELKTADGTVVSKLGAQDAAVNSVFMPFKQQTFGSITIDSPGKLFVIKDNSITGTLNAEFNYDSGLITGWASGNSDVKFRNSMQAYGDIAPSVFEQIAGTWQGNATVVCDGNVYGPGETVTNTMVITNKGEITLNGKTQLCGGNLPATANWGDRDDFLIPEVDASTGQAFIMHIDSRDLLNVAKGKVQIRFDENMQVIKLSAFIDGELFTLGNSPVKQ